MISNFYNALANKYIFKYAQISEYDWITKPMMKECLNRLHSLNLKDSEFEVSIVMNFN